MAALPLLLPSMPAQPVGFLPAEKHCGRSESCQTVVVFFVSQSKKAQMASTSSKQSYNKSNMVNKFSVGSSVYLHIYSTLLWGEPHYSEQKRWKIITCDRAQHSLAHSPPGISCLYEYFCMRLPQFLAVLAPTQTLMC